MFGRYFELCLMLLVGSSNFVLGPSTIGPVGPKGRVIDL